MNPNQSRSAKLAGSLADYSFVPILIYCVYLAKGALLAHFSNDDPMNMGWAWRDGFLRLIGQNLTFWSTAYRPMGQLYYESLYRIWGLNPLPFRVVILAFVIANAYLSWRLALLLSDSRIVAFLTGLLTAAHPKMVDLYYQNSIIYDVLAYFFSMLTLICYVSMRKRGSVPTCRQSALVVCLFIAALNSKEMSVPLPGFILAYEWLFAPRTDAGTDGPWWKRCGALPWILLALDAIYASGKIFGPRSLTEIGTYKLHISLPTYLENNLHFLRDLFYPLPIGGVGTLLGVDALLLAALVFFKRSPAIRWSCLYILIAPLPITFIQQRGGTELYIPLFGWALLTGTILGKTIQAACPSVVWPRWRISAAAVRVIVVAILASGWIYEKGQEWGDLPAAYIRAQEQTWMTMSALKEFPFRPKPGSSVLFVHDPFSDWRMAFIAELVWDDHSVIIQLGQRMPNAPTPAEIAKYDALLTFEDGRPVLVSKEGSRTE